MFLVWFLFFPHFPSFSSRNFRVFFVDIYVITFCKFLSHSQKKKKKYIFCLNYTNYTKQKFCTWPLSGLPFEIFRIWASESYILAIIIYIFLFKKESFLLFLLLQFTMIIVISLDFTLTFSLHITFILFCPLFPSSHRARVSAEMPSSVKSLTPLLSDAVPLLDSPPQHFTKMGHVLTVL